MWFLFYWNMDNHGLSPMGDLDSSSGGSDNTSTGLNSSYPNQGLYITNSGWFKIL